jgi:aminomethyltransferase
MADFGGWDMPIHYPPGILKEHLATRRFAGLFDVSHMGRFRIRGEGAAAFLQHVLSSNVEALAPWQAQYAFIPDRNGAVIDDVYLYRLDKDEYWLAVNAANRQTDWEHLAGHAQQFKDVTLKDRSDRIAMIALQGPQSVRFLEPLIEDGSLPEPARNRLSEINLCGTKTTVARTGYTGEPVGFELFADSERIEEIWSRILKAGSGAGILPVGLGGRDTLRLEAGLPLHGHELGSAPDGSPLPAFALPMASVAVSFSDRKGNFVGREALARQFEQVQRLRDGQATDPSILPRRIRPLAVLDKGITRRGDAVYVGPKQVGVVTSGTMAPYWEFDVAGATASITDQTDRRAIALAYVDTAVRTEREVDVEVRGKRLKAQIVSSHGRSEAPPYFRPTPAGRRKARAESGVASGVAKAELLIGKSLKNHDWRQRHCMNFIPSEMTPSPLVRLLQVTDPVGRYAEHREMAAALGQEVYYYQGTELIAWVERRLVEEMAEFLGCPLVEVRSISGQMANMTVFSGLVDFKNRTDRRREAERIRLAINNHIGRGGHLSSQPMGALRDYIAKDPVTERYAVINFPVREDNPYRIDVPRTAEILDQCDPEIIIFGKSMVLHPEPVGEIHRLVEKKQPRPVIMYDMAHVLGLIGPHFQQPFAEGADVVTGSTHKTFFGTQRGVIGANFPPGSPRFALWKAIQRRAFPGMVSNHHLGSLLGLLLAAIEMNAFKHEYQRQVIANAKAFARALADQGLNVEGDPAVAFTETHQVIVNVGYAKGCAVAQQLEENGLIVNYQALPSDESFTASSGLRLGVSEMTRFGMKETDFEAFAPLFADAVHGNKHVAEEVARFREGFLDLQYCFDGETVEPLKKQLLDTF